MDKEEKKKFIKESNRINRWNFIHTYLKNMVLNFASTVYYGSKMLPTGVITNVDDIKNTNLKKIYNSLNKSYDKWLTKHNHKDYLQSHIKTMFNVLITVADEDWVYRELLEMICKDLKKEQVMKDE